MTKSFVASFGLIAMTLSVPSLSSASVIMTFGGTTVANEGVVSSQTGVTTVNFDNGTAPSNYTITPNAQIISGSQSGVYLAPTGDTSDYATTGTSTIGISFASPINYFGLDWGSMDSYNTLSFTESNGTVDSFTGTQVGAAAANPVNGTASSYVNFYLSPGLTWKSATLSSSQNAFESDNHAYGNVASSTPEPATWSMLASGLGVAGLLFRRRKLSA